VKQGSEIVVHVLNDGDVAATVHWHGLRLENRYDGVPHDTQKPIPVGGTSRTGPLPGRRRVLYHPHIERTTRRHGLYGSIVVDPSDPDSWPRWIATSS